MTDEKQSPKHKKINSYYDSVLYDSSLVDRAKAQTVPGLAASGLATISRSVRGDGIHPLQGSGESITRLENQQQADLGSVVWLTFIILTFQGV